MRRRATDALAGASTCWAVGADTDGPVTLVAEWANWRRPLDAPGVRFQPGTSVRVDAVVRREDRPFLSGRHGGWLRCVAEFQARDARGRILAWSGSVEDNAAARMEKARTSTVRTNWMAPAPHQQAQRWQTRSVLYVR